MHDMEKYKDRKYTLEKYNPRWVEQFNKESKRIKRVFGDDALAIHHVGSTAVPELSGKPTIDILVLIKNVSSVNRLNEAMAQLGYTALGEYVKEGARLFAIEKDNTRLYNVHVFEEQDPEAQEMLALRDYFRSHPKEVKRYNTLKGELYRKYPHDYGAYREAKDRYMEALKVQLKDRTN